MTVAAPSAAPAAIAPEEGPLSYKVRVENYFGPLDLLLHLVKEAEVDITRVSLAQVAEQYVAHITAMKKLDLGVAGEFLVVASQLMLIKTRTLVPPELRADDGDLEGEDEEDTSVELIRKLLDYKRFKDRSRALDRMFAERSARHGRPRLRLEGETEQEPLRNMELWDLVLVYSRLLKSTRLDASMQILYGDIPIEQWMETIRRAIGERGSVAFFDLVGADRDRSRVVGTFLAVLQMARDGELSIAQDADLMDLKLSKPVPREVLA
ncbi:MAG TPA: segregation/condensation protein A [Planctomycetota bacterium]|nr:segregation/condensation protein A [Planctomycetota bacterium]